MGNHRIRIWYNDRQFEEREFSHLSDAYARYFDLCHDREELGITVMVLINGLSGAILHSVPSEV